MSVSSLDMLFENLDEGNFSGIKSLLRPAKENYEMLKTEMIKKSKTNGKEFFTPYFIETIIQHCAKERFNKVASYIQKAREEHVKLLQVVFGKIKKEKLNISKINQTLEDRNQNNVEDQCPEQKSYTVALSASNVDVTMVTAEERNNKRRNGNVPAFQPEKNYETNGVELQNKCTPQTTETLDVWDTDVIVCKFKTLHEGSWSTAYEDLKKYGSGDRRIAKVLLKILSSAYQYTKVTAERQILNMQNATVDVVWPNIADADKERAKVSIDEFILRLFRKTNAELTLPRLQEVFIDEELPQVLSGYRLNDTPIQSSVRIRRYAREAVQVTWWMNMQTPPMVIYTDRNNIDNFSPIVKPATNHIHVDFILWPALLRSTDGDTLLKGDAQFC